MNKVKLIVVLSIVIFHVLMFQNCGQVIISQSSSAEAQSTSCEHPTGTFPSDPNQSIEFFRDSNVCSNLGEACQSAFFRCENRVWTPDPRNPEEKVEFFPYGSCMSFYCDPTPQPPCPNPLPEFQCGAWGAWSDAAHSCGTRDRNCTRTLPEGCNLNTSYPQTESRTCEISTEQYVTQTEHVDACGGSYKFEIYPNTQDLIRVTFKLKDLIGGQYLDPFLWTSETHQIQRVPGSAEIYLNAPACELVTIEAHFKDKCGNTAVLGHTYTPEGCPPPNLNRDTAQGDVVIPQDSNGQTLTRARTSGISFTTNFVYEPRNVEKVVSAIYKGTDPAIIARNWYSRGQSWIKLENGKYISMEFTAPQTTQKIYVELSWEQPGDGMGPVTVAISKFPGDFYIGTASRGCLAPVLGYGTLHGLINMKDDPAHRTDCHLEPGQKYYINATGMFLQNGQYSQENYTTWMTGITFRTLPNGEYYNP